MPRDAQSWQDASTNASPLRGLQNGGNICPEFRRLQQFGELSNPTLDAPAIQVGVNFGQRLNVEQILWAMRYGLQNDKVFDTWQAEVQTANTDKLTPVNRLDFERQGAKRNIRRDPRLLMAQQEDAICARQFFKVWNARYKSFVFSCAQKMTEIAYGEENDRVGICREARFAQETDGDTANDDTPVLEMVNQLLKGLEHRH